MAPNATLSAENSNRSNLSEKSKTNKESDNQYSPVGKKKPNELGLYDMSGNVWEMCSNWYYDYSTVCDTITSGEAYTGHKVFRGGSWNTNAQSARVTARSKQGIHYRDYNTGFRLVIE